VSHVGTVGGVFREWARQRTPNAPNGKDDGESGSVVHITEVREKPTEKYARDNLRVSGLPEGEYLTAFGMYIIEPVIFEYLEHTSTHNIRDERGKLGFTDTLEKLRQEQGLAGIVVDGERFDMGDPESFVGAVQQFSQPLSQNKRHP